MAAASFRVRFVDASQGVVREHIVEAPDAASATQALREAGHQILAAQPLRGPRAKPADLALREFALELRALLLAGLGLVASMQALHAAHRGDAAGPALGRVLARLEAGKSFAASLEAASALFPPLFRASVRAGEASGQLADSLQRYADYAQSMAQLRRSVVGAAIYPAVVVSFGVAVILFLLAYVVPRFETAYALLPENARAGSGLLMHTASWVSNHIALIGATVLTLGWIAVRAWRRPAQRAIVLGLLMRAGPIARGVYAYSMARLYRTLSMMLGGGYTVPEAFAQGALVIEGTPWHARVLAARASIESGKSVAAALAAEGLTETITQRLIAAGEASAQLAPMFEHTAAHHERALAWQIERSTRLAEPVLLIAVAVMVGLIVVAMYMPILDLATAVG